MNRKIRHIFCVLLCLAMALSLTGTALAYDGSGEEQAIAIRITPPSGWAEQRAEVEVRLTDNAGTGFQSAQVQTDGGSWQDITGALEQTENRWYTVVELTENCTVYVRVTGRDGTIYEKSQYVRCFNTTNDYQNPAQDQPGDGTSAAPSSPSSSPAPQPSAGLTTPPGGQGTVIDNVSGTASESGREFFTIATPDENVFYLVIDRQRDSENVYFLNAVTESDLMALAQKDTEGPSQSAVPDPAPVCSCTQKCVPGAVNAACPVCVLSWQGCTATAEAPGQMDPEPEKPKDGGGNGTVIIVLLAALAVGAAGWYIKIYKPKHDLADAEDLDELTGAVEEPTVNEDDLPAPRAYEEPAPHSYEEEPYEPDYPEDYGGDGDV